ncbi:hypothetical protein OAD95_04095 [Flavobacteriaceae bacterium]|nr:hypothetical protein [Flavobacteriaceae bacterium]
MKNIFISFFVLLSFSLFSQQRTGISYQALILNPSGEQLPGYNNQNAPLVNTDICIEFLIIDENSSTEYSETQSVKTDKYGMVNLSIGNGSFAGGYSGGWSGIVWSEKSKKLKVNLDTTGACSSFIEISNQDLTAVPFALFAPGQEGLDGETAYEIWLSEGNIGSVQDYLDSLKGEKGDDGLSAFQVWKDLGNSETEEDFITALKGEDGVDGKSAYQIWIDAGNTGTEEEFITALKGEDGVDGKSAYQIWIDAGNTGTEEEFISSLKGESGGDGSSASQSLIITSVEVAGQNCANGGVKIETGIDVNGDGVLSNDEINSSQTKYLCNGSDGDNGTNGVDGNDGANGESGFSGDDIPSNIVLIGNSATAATDLPTSYTIPSGFIASVTSVISASDSDNVTAAMANGGTIKINGNIYRINYSLTNVNSTKGKFVWTNKFDDFYVPSGTLIESVTNSDSESNIGNNNTFYIIKLYSETRTSFVPKIITNDITIPAGKFWRISSILPRELNYGTLVGNYDRFSNITINDVYSTIIYESWSDVKRKVLVSDELWFPSGTKLGNITDNFAFSVLEYNTGGITSTNSNTDTPPDGLKVGDEWGGGIVVYIDESGKRGRIMAKEENISTVLQWSTNKDNTNSISTGYTNETFLNDKLGRDNSQAVLDYYVSNDGSAPIFEYARDILIEGYDDWYVPTVWELNKGTNYLSSSVKNFLWTSSEETSSKATTSVRALIPNGGGYSWLTRDKTLTEGESRVIPFRSFGE